jgi:hypothetical protein
MLDCHGLGKISNPGLGQLHGILRPAELIPQHPPDLGEDVVGNHQLQFSGAGFIQETIRRAAETR